MEEGMFMIRLIGIVDVDILLSWRIDSCLRKLITLKQSCLIRL